MRRRFSSSERAALYDAADGYCESCGIELQPGWHADHVHPFSQGGATDVINGAALCPSCNLTKGSKTTMEDPRSRWQSKAVDRFLSTTHDFLVTACPGAGKTRMSLTAAREMLNARAIDRVIVVAPTKAVRNQWRNEAAKFGIDLTAKYTNGAMALPDDCDGAVAVYQQVAASPKDWRILASRKNRTLVILDEIHHCADEDSTAWGPAIAEAFGAASRRLLLSGTPFRTDGTRIPFVEYDDRGVSISHHGLSYGEAVTLGVVRPIRFEVMDGSGEWLKGGSRSVAFATSVSEQDQAALVSSLYVPDGAWISSVMQSADDELGRLREELPNAGGIIVAASQDHARAYAQLMSRISGEDVPYVISGKDEDPTPIIEQYRSGSGRWIVAVDLISEGVDIPRAAVVVYASRKKTEMWFRQIVGRAVRRNGDDITATMFVPALPVLVELAERIESEADAALVEAERQVRERIEHEQRELELEIVTPLGSSEAILDRVITSGEVITDDELNRARNIQAAIGASLANVHLGDLARGLRLVSAAPVATVTAVMPATKASGDELRSILRRRLDQEVKRKARLLDLHPRDIHIHMNRLCGDTVPTASVETLEKRLGMLSEWQ